jgi:hypothetical protein
MAAGCDLPGRLAVVNQSNRCVREGDSCSADDAAAYGWVALRCQNGRLAPLTATGHVGPRQSAVFSGVSRAKPVPLGKAGDLRNGWALTVTRVNFDAQGLLVADDPTSQPAFAGFQKVLISVTGTYRGAGTSHLSPMTSFRAVGRSGFMYSPSNAFCGDLPDPNLETTNPLVYPGGVVSGYAACWMVRTTDVDSLVLTYNPLVTSPSSRIWFSLH